MAGPRELVEVMGRATGIPAETLTVYDRNLYVAGHRSRGGRGRHAPTVTARDAAGLLVSLLAGPLPKDAVPALERYLVTQPSRTVSTGMEFGSLGIPALAALTAESSFVDAVTALIESVADGSLRGALKLPRADADRPLVEVAPFLEVRASTPATIGEIQVRGVRSKAAAILYVLPQPDLDADDHGKSRRDAFATLVKRYRPDTEFGQERWAGTRAIIALGELLKEERNSE